MRYFTTVVAVCLACCAAVEGKPPNIIFILSDDLGFGDYSISNPVNRTTATIPTPNIQSLADNGIKFNRSYSGPVCAPSRCTLMTGLHMGHCTIRGNDGSYSPLLSTDITVAKALQGVYVTGLVGKWGLGDFNTTGYPLAQGFDYFIGQDSQVSCHNWYPSVLQNGTDDQCEIAANGPANLGTKCLESNPGCKWANDLYSEKAVEFIERNANGEKPFFLYLSTTTPHSGNLKGVVNEYPTPFQYYEKFSDESYSAQLRYFASAVWAQDIMVGSVLQTLRDLSIEEDTVVWFSGDNGPDDHQLDVFDDPGYFRGKKRSLHEGGTRQTIAVQWKNHIKPSTSSNHILAFWDFLPTAVELAGLPPIATDGVSVADLLQGNAQTKTHEYLYWEFCMESAINGILPQQYPPGWIQAVRFDQGEHEWKAIRSNKQKMYLYDLVSDISESVDLAGQNPGVVATAVSYMEDAHVENTYWVSANSSSERCCNACYNHAGCASPCWHQN
eukprot:TRINITY_DN3851_c0_g2_i4.p1 TRINITY_DN3851_c0_g2~~TRINITY_DN3851_c0_g2_i4.p1  ORF type:complete len:499 (+),score=122.40 TRINITY_DN3851_c0_g2_i4:52-1548(+)